MRVGIGCGLARLGSRAPRQKICRADVPSARPPYTLCVGRDDLGVPNHAAAWSKPVTAMYGVPTSVMLHVSEASVSPRSVYSRTKP